jgi:hypothetical protein
MVTWNRLFLCTVIGCLAVSISLVNGQISIGSIQTYGASSNLEAIILQGIVQLTPHWRDKPNTCGSYVFILQDETGSIEVAVRRPGRMISVKNGDRVQVQAQIQVLPQRGDPTPRVCIQASPDYS